MPLAVTGLTSGTDAANLSTYTTASVTPSSNALVLLAVHTRRSAAGTPATPTATGNGLTWVAVANMTNGTNRKITILRALGASPSAGAITIDFAGDTQTQCSWSVIEITGVDTSGTNGSGAVVQAPAGTTGTGTSSSITLAAFGSANNMAYGFMCVQTTGAITAGTGFTEVHEVSQAEVASNIQTEYKLNETAVTTSWTSSFTWSALAIEVKEAAATASIRQMALMGVG